MDQCLFASVYKNGSVGYLYFGFYQDDCQGTNSLTLNSWIHVAFVFDLSTLTQSIYQNGLLDNSCTASSAILAATSGNNQTTIGYVPNLYSIVGRNYFEVMSNLSKVCTKTTLARFVFHSKIRGLIVS